jgi:hypothetical protein
LFRLTARRLAAATTAATLILTQVAVTGAGAAGSSTKFTLQGTHLVGTTRPIKQAPKITIQPGEFEIPEHEPNAKTRRHTSAAGTPSVSTTPVVAGQVSGFAGFDGLNHKDQRTAGTGIYTNTQFSLEPPDQALCVGNGQVLEGVNNAFRVYDTSGTPLTAPTAYSQFFGAKPEVIRSTPPVFGDFISDPRCYFDPDTQRWFQIELQITQNASTGAFEAPTNLFIAVSDSADATSTWTVYEIATTDNGSAGTPNRTGCPCFADQPLIGADANGVYISVGSYTLAAFDFTGAQLYAFSKSGIETGTKTSAVHIDAGPFTQAQFGAPAFDLQPATTPTGVYATGNGGTQYFLSSLDLTAGPSLGIRSSQLGLWRLTNTASLANATPSLTLALTVVNSELYTQPPNAVQKKGPLYLGNIVHNPEELINSNEDRLQQVVYANGKLWSAINTAVKQPNGAVVTGIGWFVVNPSTNSVSNQGYLSVAGQTVTFPSIGVTAAGKAVMAFTLVGPDFFPSAAYSVLDPATGAGPVHIAAAGRFPDDGFSGYPKLNGGLPPVGRWGDYSAAVADASGNVWMGAEYIRDLLPPARTDFANWATFVYRVPTT